MSQDRSRGGSAARRLTRVLEANRSIASELDLDTVLRRIVEAARDVGEARYAALGVVGSTGKLEQFLHVGMNAADVHAVGQLPEGHGLLGALIADPRPVRLSRVRSDPRSAGFPPGHPPMTTFLGVPVRSRNAVFGNLYLCDRVDGRDFSAQDEELVLTLAASAGVAIENARLYQEAQARQRWLQAAGEIDHLLLTADALESEVLTAIAGTVCRLAAADVVAVLLPSVTAVEELEVVVAVGAAAPLLIGLQCAREGSVAGQAIDDNRALYGDVGSGLDEALRAVVPLVQLMALPLSGDVTVRGAILAGRLVPVPFGDAELEMAGSFAARAAIALELASARAAQQRVELLEERGRIAHDLHDQVIQRLFATGLSLQSVVLALPPGELQDRTSVATGDLDEAIGRIQATIRALREPSRRLETSI